MPWRVPKEIKLTEVQERILKQFAQGTHTELHLKERSQIILLGNSGYGNHQIERELKITKYQGHQYQRQGRRICD